MKQKWLKYIIAMLFIIGVILLFLMIRRSLNKEQSNPVDNPSSLSSVFEVPEGYNQPVIKSAFYDDDSAVALIDSNSIFCNDSAIIINKLEDSSEEAKPGVDTFTLFIENKDCSNVDDQLKTVDLADISKDFYQKKGVEIRGANDTVGSIEALILTSEEPEVN